MNGRIVVLNPTADDLHQLGSRLKALGQAICNSAMQGDDSIYEDLGAVVNDYGEMLHNTVEDNFWAIDKALRPEKAAQEHEAQPPTEPPEEAEPKTTLQKVWDAKTQPGEVTKAATG